MSSREKMRGMGRMLLAVLTGAVGFFLLTLGMKGKQRLEVKEDEIDRERISEDAKKTIFDSSPSDFIKQYPGVGDAAGRGKKRFADRVKGVLQQRGSNRNISGNNEDSGRGDRQDSS